MLIFDKELKVLPAAGPRDPEVGHLLCDPLGDHLLCRKPLRWLLGSIRPNSFFKPECSSLGVVNGAECSSLGVVNGEGTPIAEEKGSGCRRGLAGR